MLKGKLEVVFTEPALLLDLCTETWLLAGFTTQEVAQFMLNRSFFSISCSCPSLNILSLIVHLSLPFLWLLCQSQSYVFLVEHHYVYHLSSHPISFTYVYSLPHSLFAAMVKQASWVNSCWHHDPNSVWATQI